ncbi:hypothetical protein [Streptomyces sp. NPDC095613]|uniref:hypothetical protein n=1 Tax=Streptomyces sp. NPDC095613 TaxID=3155540 RepID=UPI003320581E
MTNTTQPPARARLSAYMSHESDADQAEFEQRVDAVVAEATAALQARIAELEAASSRLVDVEQLVEDARDKDSYAIDTYLLIDALGLDAS